MVQVVINRVENKSDEIRIDKRQVDTSSGAGSLPSENGFIVEAPSVEAVRELVGNQRRGDVRYYVADRESAIKRIQETFNPVDSKPFTTVSGEYIKPNRSSAVKSGNQKAREQAAAEERISTRRQAISESFSNANAPKPVRTIEEIREDNYINTYGLEPAPVGVPAKLKAKGVNTFLGVPIGAESVELEFRNTVTNEVTTKEVDTRTARELLAAQSVFIRDSRTDKRDAFEKAGYVSGVSGSIQEVPDGISTDLLRGVYNFPAPVSVSPQETNRYVDPNISASAKKVVGDPILYDIKKIDLAGEPFDPTRPETQKGYFTPKQEDKGIFGLKGKAVNMNTQLRVINAKLENPNLSSKDRKILEAERTFLNLGSGTATGTNAFLEIGKEAYESKGLSLAEAPADLLGLGVLGTSALVSSPISTGKKGFEAASNFISDKGSLFQAGVFTIGAAAPFIITDKGVRSGTRALRKSVSFTEVESVGINTVAKFGDEFLETTNPQQYKLIGFNRKTGKQVAADLKYKTVIELPKEVAPNVFTESYAKEVSSLTFDIGKKKKINLLGNSEFTIIDDTFSGSTDFTLKYIKQTKKGTKIKDKAKFEVETFGTVEPAEVGGVYEIIDNGRIARKGFITISDNSLIGTKGSRPLSRSAQASILTEQAKFKNPNLISAATKEPYEITIFNIATAGKEKGINIIGNPAKEIPKGRVRFNTRKQLNKNENIFIENEIKPLKEPTPPIIEDLPESFSKGVDVPTGNVVTQQVGKNKNLGLQYQSAERISKNAEDVINTYYKTRNEALTKTLGLSTDLTVIPKRRQILQPKQSLLFEPQRQVYAPPRLTQEVSLGNVFDFKQNTFISLKPAQSTVSITGQKLETDLVPLFDLETDLVPDLFRPTDFIPRGSFVPTTTIIPIIKPKLTPISLFNEPKRRGRGKKSKLGFAPTPDLLSAVTGYTAKRKKGELFSGAEIRGLSPKAAKITKAASKNIFGL